jgi:hypothetical protein
MAHQAGSGRGKSRRTDLQQGLRRSSSGLRAISLRRFSKVLISGFKLIFPLVLIPHIERGFPAKVDQRASF